MNFNNIISNLNFVNIKNVSFKEIMKLLKIRNKENIRNKMFSNKYITKLEHILWSNKIKKATIEAFFLIYYKDILCGGLGIKNFDSKIRECDWAFYISDKINFPGLGASIELKSINFLFKKYKLSRINCYVLKDNQSVVNLHSKFFFSIVPLKENKLHNYNINMSKNNVIKLCLDLKIWEIKSKEFIQKFKINEKKILY